MAERCRTVIAVLLSMLMPGTLLAANTGAMVYAQHGDVLLNGVVAPDSSAIFAGDRLSTTAASAANVVLEGSSLVLDPQSTLLYQGTFFDLTAGGASVITRNQMQLRSGHVTVTPVAAAETHYRMAHQNGSLRVIVLAGSVKVVDHGAETLLATGNAMSLNEDQAGQPDQNSRRKRAVPPPVPMGVSTGSTLLIGGAAAAGAAALVYLTTRGPCRQVSTDGTCQ